MGDGGAVEQSECCGVGEVDVAGGGDDEYACRDGVGDGLVVFFGFDYARAEVGEVLGYAVEGGVDFVVGVGGEAH